MPTGMGLLHGTVEELKKVDFKHWKYRQYQNASSYSYFPPAMQVTVFCRQDELSKCYFMDVKDIAENQKVTYPHYPCIESLYDHLEAQRSKDQTVEQASGKPLGSHILLKKLLEYLE